MNKSPLGLYDPTAEMQKGIETFDFNKYKMFISLSMTRPQKCKRGLKRIRYISPLSLHVMTRPQKCKRGLKRATTTTVINVSIVIMTRPQKCKRGLKLSIFPILRCILQRMTRPQKCKRGLKHSIPHVLNTWKI